MMNESYKGILGFFVESQGSGPHITKYAELVNLLKESFPKISWAGIYEKDQNKDELFLSAFVGDLACEKININNGVCGKAFCEVKTQLVHDVSKIPYHIACSNETKSELVIPIFADGACVAVLDLDSNELGAFNEEDAKALKEILEYI